MPAEFFAAHFEKPPELLEVAIEFGRRKSNFILAAGDNMKKSFNRSRITPIHRRIRHRSYRNIKIQRESEQKEKAAKQRRLPPRTETSCCEYRGRAEHERDGISREHWPI